MDQDQQTETNSSQESPTAASAVNLVFQAPDFSTLPPAPPKQSCSDDETEDQGGKSASSRRRKRRNNQDGRSRDKNESGPSEQDDQDSADESQDKPLRRRNRDEDDEPEQEVPEEEVVSRRRRRRRRGDMDIELDGGAETDPPNTITRVRAPRAKTDTTGPTQVASVRGSTRLEAKRQRRRETRESSRRNRGISEAEFLARRESVDRQMMVRQREGRIQIAVLEDGVLAEHFVSHTTQDSLIGNVYLGKVQNVLPSMEAAFVDIGRNRNAVLYAGEVNWDAAGLDGQPRKIENALKSGDSVLVQVTKDPVGHKGARLTSQVSLPGRYLVYVPSGSMTGISRKLPDTERSRLKKILKDNMPENAGVIVRTAAEGASEEELVNDINRLHAMWSDIQAKADAPKTLAPELLYSEPDLTIKVVRDVFNEDFSKMVIQGDEAWDNIEAYVTYVAPDLLDRLHKWDEDDDIFAGNRIDEQLIKALDRKVYLPSGGSLVIDRTEAMTVVDVNTGKFTGSGGNLEETVTKNNLEAAEEIARQLRLRDIGGIIVIDFIDMVLEANRDLVLRRLIECLGRDRTKHQVAEVTSLGLVQMTRKRMGTGLIEVFSETCQSCAGRGILTHSEPLENRKSYNSQGESHGSERSSRSSRSERRRRNRERQQEQKNNQREDQQQDQNASAAKSEPAQPEQDPAEQARAEQARAALASIAAATVQSEEDTKSEPKAGQDDAEQVATLTIAGEAVPVPRGQARREDPRGKADLQRLSEAIDKLGIGSAEMNAGAAQRDQDDTDTGAEHQGRKPRRRGRGRGRGEAHEQQDRQPQRHDDRQDKKPAAESETKKQAPAVPAVDRTKVQVAEYDQPKAVGRRSAQVKPAADKQEQKQAEHKATSEKTPTILGVGVPASVMKNE
ncbi:Rne/Rng family ribonuclease [Micrococcoides hystricis]|uniref:Rne/Rng family ribonuclease n=1 Tax=Micrococcoides hystricis TaxID=1572761 RepID=A0ABV6P988_9MICC